MHFLILLVCLLLGGVAHAQPAAPLEDGLAQHLLNRLGYGPAPGEVARVRALGVQAWVDGQLAPPPMPPRLEARLGTLPGPEAALLRAIASPRQLEAVLVRFWLDYFKKQEAAGAALRPQVLGRYADLRAALGASARGKNSERAAMEALLRHIVSAPSASLQGATWRVWEATGGEQRAVLRQLLTSPEFLAPSQWNSKEKDGFRFVASAVRAAGLAVDNAAPLVAFVRASLSDPDRAEFVERLATGRLALAMAPVRPHEYASSAPPLRAGVAGETPLGTVAQPGPVLMAAPTPSAAAMAAARTQPAQPERLRALLLDQKFLRY
ncbi:DUF1800 family protein [Massilia alkalitolerans]|uniref:DUF1800 family protein n=1 Tax=Massilia alkalitolerans TaxID=286638 RepID=UPI000419B039|nr:DUF1800 family protein [Massilia alkalitolerans]